MLYSKCYISNAGGEVTVRELSWRELVNCPGEELTRGELMDENCSERRIDLGIVGPVIIVPDT